MGYKDPEKQRKYQAKWKRDKNNFMRKYVWSQKDKPCADCGVKYSPWVMDFDHVRGVKIQNVAYLAMTKNRDAVLEEIAKCDVVCSNCHRERTYIRNKERWSDYKYESERFTKPESRSFANRPANKATKARITKTKGG
jgi:hypothetical protein